MSSLIQAGARSLWFRVGYDLECEYECSDGHRYRRRLGAHVGNTRPDYIETGVLPLIGTVSCRDQPHRFPPEEVREALSREVGLDLVGARWSEDFEQVEYDGAPPPRPVRVWGGTAWMDPRWANTPPGVEQETVR